MKAGTRIAHRASKSADVQICLHPDAAWQHCSECCFRGLATQRVCAVVAARARLLVTKCARLQGFVHGTALRQCSKPPLARTALLIATVLIATADLRPPHSRLDFVCRQLLTLAPSSNGSARGCRCTHSSLQVAHLPRLVRAALCTDTATAATSRPTILTGTHMRNTMWCDSQSDDIMRTDKFAQQFLDRRTHPLSTAEHGLTLHTNSCISCDLLPDVTRAGDRPHRPRARCRCGRSRALLS
jgi:hypothetical protein